VNLSRKIINETRAEEWAVNASVHCNTWGENCTKEDFAPIVKAFKDVCSLFECKHCGTLLELSLVDNKLASLSCRCGEEVFNLKIKSK
jgi:hypothetical protein